MTPTRPVCIACSIFRRELEALKGRLDISPEIRYLGSMLHMVPGTLEQRLGDLLQEERSKGHAVILAYGDCCPGMLGLREARTEGINCCELILGTERYQRLRKEGAFFLMPEWTLRWRDIFEEELGLDTSTAKAFMGEMHTRLVYLDTGLVPVPAQELEAAALYTGLPWSILAVGLEPFLLRLREAIDRTPSHE